MGGQRVWRNRLSTATTILVILSASQCSATIYSLHPDGIINHNASPEPVVPPWRWTAEDETPVTREPPYPVPSRPPTRPPPRLPPRPQLPTRPRPKPWSPAPPPRVNTFQSRKPPWTEAQNEFPDAWKKALVRAAFESLRNGAGKLFGYRGITPSIQDDVDRELWNRLSVADFIGSSDYENPDKEGEQTEVATIAEGLLIHKEGDLQFYIVDGHTTCDCENARTVATWSIRRLRHSGPGRGKPQFQLHFSVVPVTEEQQIEIEPEPERVVPSKYNPSPLYRGIPIFTRNGPKEYNPRFIEEYGSVVSAFLRHRDSLPKYQTIKENKDDKNKQQQFIPVYESQTQEFNIPTRNEYQNGEYHLSTRDKYGEPPREDYSKPSEEYSKPSEEYEASLTEEYSKPTQGRHRESIREDLYHQYDERNPTYLTDEDSQEEYQQRYQGRQQSSYSRRQNQSYYRQRYTSYQPYEETRQQYNHQYKTQYSDQSISVSGYQQFSPQIFRPSTPFERFSEADPLFQSDNSGTQKAASQGTAANQEQLSQVSLIPVQTIQSIEIPVANFYQTEWQPDNQRSNSHHKDEDATEKISSVKGEWTTINAQTKPIEPPDKVYDTPKIKLKPPFKTDYNENRQSSEVNSNRQKSLTETYPIGSQSLSALARLGEHLDQSFNHKRSTQFQA